MYDGAVMYVRTWKKGSKIYASIVKSTRNGTKVSQETVAYLGEVTFDQIPYLKAAYAKINHYWFIRRSPYDVV